MLNVKKISGKELLIKIKNKEELQLLTIIKTSEFKPENIPFTNISFSDIENDINIIRKDIPVIIACDEGEKSYFFALFIERKNKQTNIYSLEGGFRNLKEILKAQPINLKI